MLFRSAGLGGAGRRRAGWDGTHDSRSHPSLAAEGVPRRPNLAEGEGFEPSVQLLTVLRFSKPLPSTTRPSLRGLCQGTPRAKSGLLESRLDRERAESCQRKPRRGEGCSAPETRTSELFPSAPTAPRRYELPHSASSAGCASVCITQGGSE